MSGDRVFLIEMVLVFGGVLAWAVWEVISTRRSLRRDRALKASILQSIQTVKKEVHHGEHSEGTKGTTGPGPQSLR